MWFELFLQKCYNKYGRNIWMFLNWKLYYKDGGKIAGDLMKNTYCRKVRHVGENSKLKMGLLNFYYFLSLLAVAYCQSFSRTADINPYGVQR